MQDIKHSVQSVNQRLVALEGKSKSKSTSKSTSNDLNGRPLPNTPTAATNQSAEDLADDSTVGTETDSSDDGDEHDIFAGEMIDDSWKKRMDPNYVPSAEDKEREVEREKKRREEEREREEEKQKKREIEEHANASTLNPAPTLVAAAQAPPPDISVDSRNCSRVRNSDEDEDEDEDEHEDSSVAQEQSPLDSETKESIGDRVRSSQKADPNSIDDVTTRPFSAQATSNPSDGPVRDIRPELASADMQVSSSNPVEDFDEAKNGEKEKSKGKGKGSDKGDIPDKKEWIGAAMNSLHIKGPSPTREKEKKPVSAKTLPAADKIAEGFRVTEKKPLPSSPELENRDQQSTKLVVSTDDEEEGLQRAEGKTNSPSATEKPKSAINAGKVAGPSLDLLLSPKRS